MKNILIPTDFSEHAYSAMNAGAYIARKTNSVIHLIHVVKAPEDWEILSSAQQNEAPEILGAICEAEAKAMETSKLPVFKGLTVIPRVFGGVPYKSIGQYSESYLIDLIIMGAHGVSESSELFIGSTAQRVLRSVSCPVLSVKKDFKPTSLKRILFASDFNDDSIKKTISAIIHFAEEIDARVDFVYINTPARFVDSATLNKRLEALGPQVNNKRHKLFVYDDYTSEKGILNVSKKVKSNLLALATHNRKGKKNYQLGVTETLLYHSDLPILSLVM